MRGGAGVRGWGRGLEETPGRARGQPGKSAKSRRWGRTGLIGRGSGRVRFFWKFFYRKVC